MASIEKIVPGQILWDVRNRHTYWPVEVISVDKEKRTAEMKWNHNKNPVTYVEQMISKLQYSEPKSRLT